MIKLGSITPKTFGLYVPATAYDFQTVVYKSVGHNYNTYWASEDIPVNEPPPETSSKWILLNTTPILDSLTDNALITYDGQKYVGIDLPQANATTVLEPGRRFVLTFEEGDYEPQWRQLDAPPRLTAKALAVGGHHNGHHNYGNGGFIGDDGQVYIWGRASSNSLGDGDQDDSSTSTVRVTFPNNFRGAKYFRLGFDKSYVIDEEDRLWSWGYNGGDAYHGGNRGVVPYPIPFGVTTGSYGFFEKRVQKFFLGGRANNDNVGAYLDTNNNLYVFGRNNHGTAGAGSTSDYISVGWVHGSWKNVWTSCDYGGQGIVFAVREDNKFMGWGTNHHGNLGLGDTANRYTPTEITLPRGKDGRHVLDMWFVEHWNQTSNHTGVFLMLDDHSLWHTGVNHYGIEGRGYDGGVATTWMRVLMDDADESDVYPVDIFPGGGDRPNMGAIMSDGTVRTWGYGNVDNYRGGCHGFGHSDIHTPSDPAINAPWMNEAKFIKGVYTGHSWGQWTATDNNTRGLYRICYLLREDGVVFSAGYNYPNNRLGRQYETNFTNGVWGHAFGSEYYANTRWETKWREKGNNHVHNYSFYPMNLYHHIVDIEGVDHSSEGGIMMLTKDGDIFTQTRNNEGVSGSVHSHDAGYYPYKAITR